MISTVRVARPPARPTRLNHDTHIGIIGGAGQMGQFFFRVCKNLGYHNLSFSDNNNKAAAKAQAELGLNEMSSVGIARNCDITIVSVPISRTVQVINEVGPHVRPDALFAHFTSIQTPAIEAMADFRQCEHLGIHIMAAPSNNLELKNTNVVLVPDTIDGEWLSDIEAFFGRTQANVVEMESKTHDRFSALIQAQVHINAFLFGYVLRKARQNYGIELQQLAALATPPFVFQKYTLGRILASGNPDLYGAIQMENPAVIDMLTLYEEGLERLSDMICTQDVPAFHGFFDTLTRYYGRHRTRWAKIDSDAIIQQMQVSYEAHLEGHRQETRRFYADEYTSAARTSGLLDHFTEAGPVHQQVMQTSRAFVAIGVHLNAGDFQAAQQQAKTVAGGLHKLAHRDLLKDVSALKQATDAFISLCREAEEMAGEVNF